MVRILSGGVDISEVYSPRRVVAMAEAMGLRGGLSMDLTTLDEEGKPWNFNVPEMRRKAVKHIVRQRPYFLIGSPECRQFSRLQNLNWKSWDQDAYRHAVRHLEFVCQLNRLQIRCGRYLK